MVVGQGAAVEGGFEALAHDPRFVMCHDVADMASLMGEADVAILAAGTLAYEALASGLPGALIGLDESQSWEAAEIAHRGAAIYVGTAADLDRSVVDAALQQLASPRDRAAMSACAQALVDGTGRARVADAIARVAGRPHP